MNKFNLMMVTALAAGLTAGAAAAQEKVRIAFIDPLSGPFATTGTQGLAIYRHSVKELVNEPGALLDGQAEFEMVPFDNKISAKESLIQLQVAMDQGIRIIAQGASSGVANALTEAVAKHNRRNPDDPVIFLNHSAVDPALTNDKCQFWHFRFDANADIKMDALTDDIAANPDINKVYVIGQDYSFGKAVAAAAQRFLKDKRPDIEIVGNELHPIGKVKDFTPYARKIVGSGADAVITGNWGGDMVGLGKAVMGAGFDKPIYTYYGATSGITAAFGEEGDGIVKLVGAGQVNPPATPEAQEFVTAFYENFPDLDFGQPQMANVAPMLAAAINEVGNATDIKAIAYALEGMEYDSIVTGKTVMRESDHQAIQTVTVQGQTPDDILFEYDKSGRGMAAETIVELASNDSATTCEMKRP
ncbi:branched-chain amino acid ABC transporter substrate-binding protein [Ruegeria sp. Ofav3-42]|uniref:branched-chain amino acid ABC transporter substrate-binding protein n=1 Tax=Ruegeria sp. Ofav3-42 TaxID=2917759 RepID=UPI001EF5D129|nr:branched-chain amino acid ABC transporter substrate-binding protein [Ruegeria sp. Ofav3-42]MCG7519933.1 branched-chain amino acid ABC transporter substrate-binding protein [Ruegeria sp. Ofav3-42]